MTLSMRVSLTTMRPLHAALQRGSFPRLFAFGTEQALEDVITLASHGVPAINTPTGQVRTETPTSLDPPREDTTITSPYRGHKKT
jgi:hypothetical protein